MSEDESSYIRLLPAIYARGEGDTPSFVERYLQIAESLLARRDGTPAGVQRGMAVILDTLPSLLYPRLSFLFPGSKEPMPPIASTTDPTVLTKNLLRLNDYLGIVDIAAAHKSFTTPMRTAILAWLADFLDWTAGWIAFTPDASWSIDERRNTLARVMLLYRKRGTSEGLEGLLQLFFGYEITEVKNGKVTIKEKVSVTVADLVRAPPLELGRTTLLASAYSEGDGVLDGVRPFSFAVNVSFLLPESRGKAANQVKVASTLRAVGAFTDVEKPLHTRYVLNSALVEK